MDVVGRVIGTEDATPLEFWVGVGDRAFLQLDDVVALQRVLPDGEIVRINTAQIVFVMSATNTGADKRARSKIQVLNGSIDVLESIDEVSQALKTNDSVS